MSTRQDRTHFKLITEAKCSLIRARRGHRDLLPLCANYIIRRMGERGLLSEDKTQPSHLYGQHKARKPVSEPMSMNLLVFSKNMPRKLAALEVKYSSGNFKLILLHLLLLLHFLHFFNMLLKIGDKLMIRTSKENFPCDG